jgi:hypothetical protein
LYSSRAVIVGTRMLDRRRWTTGGDVILDALVPGCSTAPLRDRSRRSRKHRAAGKLRKPKRGGKYMKLERYTSIASGVQVGLTGCPDCPNHILYWKGWWSWQSGLH